MALTLYQTLEDRGNPDNIENDGPFECSRNNAWLGRGYYFWDSFREWAEWWGNSAYGSDNFVICQADGQMDNTCWDLVGNMEHLLELEECFELLSKRRNPRGNRIRVSDVIEYLKDANMFDYKAIRAVDNSRNADSSGNNYQIFFTKGNSNYLNLRPQIQICLLNKKALSLCNFRIIFPEDYIN